MSVLVNHIRPDFYLDSVALMRLSVRLEALEGVERASLMLASPANKQILKDAALLSDASAATNVDDLVIAVRAKTAESADAALASAQLWLQQGGTGSASGAGAVVHQPASLQAATGDLPQADLALISVPGQFATREAHKALDLGLNVMMFSDNVSKDDELELKRKASSLDLLVMGPDCGTAIIGGVPLAFANVVPRGEVGIIAASGTGLQEVSTLLAQGGQGVSHAIGTGGRDLSDEIGGLTSLAAIELLTADDATREIVFISKPPGDRTAATVLNKLASCGKKATVCFLGWQHSQVALQSDWENIHFAHTLHDTAEWILQGGILQNGVLGNDVASDVSQDHQNDSAKINPGQFSNERVLHGLFAGGTMCAESQVILRDHGVAFTSNAPIPGAKLNGSISHSTQSNAQLLDLGADEYTIGRPHPMLEPQVRSDILHQSLRVADVVLLDVVLGYGSHRDPAGAVADVVMNARSATSKQQQPIVIASVCGTNEDPQPRYEQVAKLERVGIQVASSNAQATKMSIQALK